MQVFQSDAHKKTLWFWVSQKHSPGDPQLRDHFEGVYRAVSKVPQLQNKHIDDINRVFMGYFARTRSESAPPPAAAAMPAAGGSVPDNPYLQPRPTQNYQKITEPLRVTASTPLPAPVPPTASAAAPDAPDTSAYELSFRPAQQLAPAAAVSETCVAHGLLVSSRDRDTHLYPHIEHFDVPLQTHFKNVAAICLERIIFPNFDFYRSEPYFFVSLLGVTDTYTGSSDLYPRVLAQICPKRKCRERAHVEQSVCAEKVFATNPLSLLARVSVRLLDAGGAPLAMPTDAFPIREIQVVSAPDHTHRIIVDNPPRNRTRAYHTWLADALHPHDTLIIRRDGRDTPVHFVRIEDADAFVQGAFCICVYAPSLDAGAGDGAQMCVQKMCITLQFRIKTAAYDVRCAVPSNLVV